MNRTQKNQVSTDQVNTSADSFASTATDSLLSTPTLSTMPTTAYQSLETTPTLSQTYIRVQDALADATLQSGSEIQGGNVGKKHRRELEAFWVETFPSSGYKAIAQELQDEVSGVGEAKTIYGENSSSFY